MIFRIFISLALVIPPSAFAERARKNSVNSAVNRLIQFVNPGWVSVDTTTDENSPDGTPGSDTSNAGDALDLSSGEGALGNGATNGGSGAGGSNAGGRRKGSGLAGAGSGSGAGDSSSGSGSGSGDLEQAELGSAGDGAGANVANEEIGIPDGQATAEVGGPGSPAGMGTQNSPAKGQEFPLMYAMCMFFDEMYTSTQGSGVVKGLVDAAGRCGVNLVVYPITVADNYQKAQTPNDGAAETMIDLQKAACNIKEYLKIDTGVSTSICVNDNKMSDQMCKQTETINDVEVLKTNTAGCAQVQSKVNEVAPFKAKFFSRYPDQKTAQAEWDLWLKDQKKHNGTFSEKGNVGQDTAPSIEDIEGCKAGTVNHEAIGHSMFGHPNGSGDGNGIGFEKSGDDGQAPYWTEAGCAAIRRNAIANKVGAKWDPNRKNYYTKSTALWDLQSRRGIFQPPGGIPAAGPVTAPPPLGPGGGRVSVVTQDLPPKNGSRGRTGGNPPSRDNGPGQPDGTNLAVVDPEGRHRKQLAEKLLGALEDPDAAPDVYDAEGAPPENGTGAPSARIGFNDGAKKKRPGESSGGNGSDTVKVGPRLERSGPSLNDFSQGQDVYAVSTGDRPTDGLGGGAGRVGFDDSRKKGATGGSSSSNRRPSSTGGYVGGGSGGEGGGLVEGAPEPNLAVGGPTGGLDSIGGRATTGIDVDPFESSLEGGFFEALGDKERAEIERRRNATWRRGGSAPENLRPRVETEGGLR